jgi:hypothetical protein
MSVDFLKKEKQVPFGKFGKVTDVRKHDKTFNGKTSIKNDAALISAFLPFWNIAIK